MKEFFNKLVTEWWGITVLCVLAAVVWLLLSTFLYRRFFKRFYDILLSGIAIAVISPLLIILAIVGAIVMKGNPFFVQPRPGKNGKVFHLVKFRSMTREKDANGELLSDGNRLTGYGKFLRSTSLDELPELFNIFIGQMSIVGPRPLLVQYLPLYDEEQKHRHDVRPGLAGYAQVHGRNAISWEEKFKMDVQYTRNYSFWGDIKIILLTVVAVFKRSGISHEGQATMEYFTGNGKDKEPNILIVSAGRRVELIGCFKAARDKLNVGGKIIAADISNAAPALYFADEACTLPRVSDENYITELIELCKSKNIALVVPTIDTELEILATNRDKIESESGAKVMISNAESVAACCNKFKTAAFLQEHGFDFPKVVTEADIKDGNLAFPLFIKPENGSSSINAFKVNNAKQLELFLDYIDKPIVQEYVDGTEYTADCFCDFDGNVISVVPRVRIATRGGEIMRGRIDKNPSVISTVKRLAQAFGFIGQTTVQCFLCADGSVKIIEINPRFGGGAPMSIYAGADSCEYLYRLLSGEKLEYREDYEDNIVFSRYDNSVRVHE